MAIRNIVKVGDPILNKKCKSVENFDQKLSILIDDMIETLNTTSGVGLAAPQVGILRQVIIVKTDDSLIELVNPVILSEAGSQTGGEGCLSFPGKYAIVTCPEYIEVKAQDRNGNYFEMKGHGLLARILSHEIDHLNGITLEKRADRFLTQEEIKKYAKKQNKNNKKSKARRNS